MLKKPFTKNLQRSTIPNLEVLDLQVFLEEKGFADFIPTGIFGVKTANAIANFQKKYSITPALGNFGTKTRMIINKMNFPTSTILYYTAKSVLGIDASPFDRADDSVACVETINAIAEMAIGRQIGGGLSTYSMYNTIKARPDLYMEVSQQTCKPGDIIISPTGYGNGNLSNGHVGIVGENSKIMSNSSSTGKWSENFTISTWYKRYSVTGGFPVRFYRIY